MSTRRETLKYGLALIAEIPFKGKLPNIVPVYDLEQQLLTAQKVPFNHYAQARKLAINPETVVQSSGPHLYGDPSVSLQQVNLLNVSVVSPDRKPDQTLIDQESQWLQQKVANFMYSQLMRQSQWGITSTSLILSQDISKYSGWEELINEVYGRVINPLGDSYQAAAVDIPDGAYRCTGISLDDNLSKVGQTKAFEQIGAGIFESPVDGSTNGVWVDILDLWSKAQPNYYNYGYTLVRFLRQIGWALAMPDPNSQNAQPWDYMNADLNLYAKDQELYKQARMSNEELAKLGVRIPRLYIPQLNH